ncbi:ThuA domain-containing protein [Tamlana agarivorans]|uniref:ThuA domain-containing protein n=1 Tax=Pseudotamlana agarivorans TaxID=481183 RepID=A0ACC5U901_9FLAO|nr:ThuA domain-containing protein [Tamlana agarivorans]MBU2950803.1 ThuA domain-containing protein [Tamlana agarivorans]
MRNFLVGIISLFTILQVYSCNSKKDKIKVLIVDGQNNHVVWPKSTIMMKQYLEETNLFEVDIARTKFLNKSKKYKDWLAYAGVAPGVEGKPKTDPDFNPNFSNYDVVISNFGWQAAPWPEQTQKNFETYMKNGGGFVSIHAADNSFPEWKAYNEMIAVGGWGGRTEKDGPYLYVDKHNNVKKDHTPGAAGKHGKLEAFMVTTFNTKHPITTGFPKTWMHAADECYAYLRGPAKNVEVLATAVSTLKKPELEQKEPVAMTIKYGKGRIFHTTLGHDETSFESVGLITLLLRGTEWAATGKVKQKRIPIDFPTESQVSTKGFKYKG